MFRIKSCAKYTPSAGYLVEILENLLFHVLSNYACKFAINLFPITWGPFQNVNLLYFLLKIQISNGCNVLNIAGNPIKDIIVNLSFLCVFRIKSCAKYTLTSRVSGGNLGKPTCSCTIQFCMQICHKPFPPSHEGHFKMLIYSIFYWKYRLQMAVMCLILQENPIKDITVNLSFLSSGSKVM